MKYVVLFLFIPFLFSNDTFANIEWPEVFSNEKGEYTLEYLYVKPDGTRKKISINGTKYVFIPTFIESQGRSPSRFGFKPSHNTKLILKEKHNNFKALYYLEENPDIEIQIELKQCTFAANDNGYEPDEDYDED